MPDTSPAISWSWTLGNGNTSVYQTPPQQVYNSAGVYNIQLIATNSSGCKDTVNTTVAQYHTKLTPGGYINLPWQSIALSAAGGCKLYLVTTQWLKLYPCTKPVASPDSLTVYSVKGTTVNGCSNLDTVIVDVKQRFTMFNNYGRYNLQGSSIRLFAKLGNYLFMEPACGVKQSVTIATLWQALAITTPPIVLLVLIIKLL